MAKTVTAAEPAQADPTTEKKTMAKAEAKRKMLTPAEKVAKLEAELKAAREKAAAKAKSQITQLLEQRAKLAARRAEIDEKIESINAELKSIGHTED